MLGTEVFWQTNAKNVMKNHILKTPTFTLIMLLSIQPIKIPEKMTVFFNNSHRKFNFFRWAGINAKKMGFKANKKYIYTPIFFSFIS